MLFFTAVVLATALDMLVRQLQRWVIKRSLAVFLSIGILLALLAGFVALIVPPFAAQFQQLVELLPEGLALIQNWLNLLEDRILGQYFPDIPDINTLVQRLQPLITRLLGRSFDFFSASASAVLELLLVLVLTIMLLANPRPYRQALIRLFPASYRQRADEILSHCGVALESWTIGVLIEMVFIAALSGIGLWILQVPLALAHALLAGLLNFIPNIGPASSVVFPVAIALLDAPWKAVAVLILYIVIQQIESYWLTPLVMAKQVSLLPAVTLVAQIFFASFFGFLGLLLALPLTVVAKTWLEEGLIKNILDNS